MNTLVFANIPHDCREDELTLWLEEKGYTVARLRLIRDIVTSTSPAFARVQLAGGKDQSPVEALNRQEFRGYRVLVRAERTPPLVVAS
jgi:hypothetical protein